MKDKSCSGAYCATVITACIMWLAAICVAALTGCVNHHDGATAVLSNSLQRAAARTSDIQQTQVGLASDINDASTNLEQAQADLARADAKEVVILKWRKAHGK